MAIGFREVMNHRLQLALHDWRHVRPRLKEVLEVGGRKKQHLACTVHAIEVTAIAKLGHPLSNCRTIADAFLRLNCRA